ncbi:hypothetical protein K435DRAFT_606693, partial [Dendrothele bispora CBS 962.96]
GLLCILLASLHFYKRRRTSTPYPPGPKGLPILGNALDVPVTYQWLKFAEWTKEYGSDVISLDLFGKRLIVLDSLEAVSNIFDKQSAKYSSR